MQMVTTALVFLAVAVVVATIATKALRVPVTKQDTFQAPPPIPMASPVAFSAATPGIAPFCPQCGQQSLGGKFCAACGFELASLQPLQTARVSFQVRNQKSKNAFWPSIYDEKSARAAARQGMWAAFFCAGATVLLVLLAREGVQIPIDGFGTTALVDATVMAFVGIGIRNMSRLAAVGGLGVYIIEQFYTLSNTHNLVGLPIPMIFALIACFISGIRGTFALQRYRS